MDENIQLQLEEQNSLNKVPPRTWLVESILITVFCCLPFGIIGIVNASKVESRFYAGDIDGANRASSDAKTWTSWGLGTGLVVYLIVGIMILIGGVL